jgi:hypothetical protein
VKQCFGVYRVSLLGKRRLSTWSDKVDAIADMSSFRAKGIKAIVEPIVINHGEHAKRKQRRAAAIADAKAATREEIL